MSSANTTPSMAHAATLHALRFTLHASRIRSWWLSDGVREVRRLALLPALISFIMLWPALLSLGVFAPTDIVAYDPLTGGFPPGERRTMADNPLLGDPVDSFIPWKLYARSEVAAGRF